MLEKRLSTDGIKSFEVLDVWMRNLGLFYNDILGYKNKIYY